MLMSLLRRIINCIYLVNPKWAKRIKRIYWRVWFIRLDLKTRYNIFRGKPDIFRSDDLVYINPAEIHFWNSDNCNKIENIRVVEDGDWDLKRQKFEDMDIFIALKDHFENGVHLSKSNAHKRILQEIQEGISKWGCKTEEDLNARWRKIDELYYDIKINGFKTQKELGNPDLVDEITVNIGRNGEFLFEDGRHRLSIAKILDLKSVPVLITKRHYEWAKFKAKLLSYNKEHRIYQPLLHPDLLSMQSLQGNERNFIILNNLPCSTGTVLDIGSNWGYFCHTLEDLGFTCYAVENNTEALYFLETLKGVGRKNFEILSKSIFEVDKFNYDIVLALNIFHHFLKNENDYHKLTDFLGKLNIGFMFFEPHNFNEPQMKNSYINYNELEFIDYIISNSCLNTYKFLGRLEKDGRGIYLLNR